MPIELSLDTLKYSIIIVYNRVFASIEQRPAPRTISNEQNRSCLIWDTLLANVLFKVCFY